MTSVLAFIFVLGVLVFVHELGHFLAARRVGVRVLTFAVGFGPRVVGITRGDTEYCLRLIPLGGYVRMAGDHLGSRHPAAPDDFLAKTRWQRFQVLIMGPVMNLALAWLVMAVVFSQGMPAPVFDQEPAVLGDVVPNSPAAAAGMMAGDRIVAVDGIAIARWADLSTVMAGKTEPPQRVDVVRDGERRSVTIPASSGAPRSGRLGVLPDARPEIDEAADAAMLGGLRPGDVILTLNGQSRPSATNLVEVLRSPGERLRFEVRRAGQVHAVDVDPAAAGAVLEHLKPYATRTEYPGAVASLSLSARYNWASAGLILRTLGGLFTRETRASDMMGPIGIMMVSGDAARLGILALLQLLAMISLNLGLLNLLPIPVLDGGHIALLALEGISRRDFSVRVKERLLATGFVLLVTLMGTVIYNDLMRVAWIERLVPWR